MNEILLQILDLENSILSVASITSEVADSSLHSHSEADSHSEDITLADNLDANLDPSNNIAVPPPVTSPTQLSSSPTQLSSSPTQRSNRTTPKQKRLTGKDRYIMDFFYNNTNISLCSCIVIFFILPLNILLLSLIMMVEIIIVCEEMADFYSLQGS